MAQMLPGVRQHLETLLIERKWNRFSWLDSPIPHVSGLIDDTVVVCIPLMAQSEFPVQSSVLFAIFFPWLTHTSVNDIAALHPTAACSMCIIDADSNFCFLDVSTDSK